MEAIGGVVLVVLGLFIIVFGNSYVRSSRERSGARPRIAYVIDSLLKWGMGLMCIWFGAHLLIRGIRM
jgi:Fe2+ transport system protein B